MKKNNNLDKVMKMFGIMWIITAIGAFFGQFVPQQFILPIGILTLIIVIGTFFVRKSKAASSILVYTVSYLIGITLYSIIGFYIGELGLQVVILVITTCTVIFAFLGFFGYKLKKDLSPIGNILFFALLALVVFSFATIFIGVSNLIMIIASGIGVLIFVGYTIYDFNQIAQHGVEDDMISITALNLYLDLLNLILETLKLLYYIKEFLDE